MRVNPKPIISEDMHADSSDRVLLPTGSAIQLQRYLASRIEAEGFSAPAHSETASHLSRITGYAVLAAGYVIVGKILMG